MSAQNRTNNLVNMPSSLSMLTKAFSSPALDSTLAMAKAYVVQKVLPPVPTPPPPEEPYGYLPSPGPYATGFSWEYSFGILGTMLGFSAAVFSLGAALGISSSFCVGKRSESVLIEEQILTHKDEYEAWAEENYEKTNEGLMPRLEPAEIVAQAKADVSVPREISLD